MKKATYLLQLAITVICCIFVSTEGCKQKKQQQASAVAPAAVKDEHTFAVRGSVREMSITPVTTDFPEHEGKSEFMSYCAICHSLRYISMQPDFSRNTWDEIVHKMTVKYNAPIDSVTCKKIVDYLVAVKGEK